jgi:phosphoribosylamine--glycine ligase
VDGTASSRITIYMSKLILVTRDWSGLGLAVLAKMQGSDVIVAYDYDKEADDLEHTELIGDGLLEKIPVAEATKKLIMSGNVWLFDSNGMPALAERLKKADEAIVGTSALSSKMENDRDYAVGIAESVGLKAPETQKFTDYSAAIKFLESNKDKSYVYKPYEGDATSTYVPQEREDLSKANEELREYLSSLSEGSPKFILQEVVEGIEVAFDMWLRNGSPVATFMDLEAKRKMTGDLGENIGCAGGYVSKLRASARGIRETLGKYLNWDGLKGYTGTIDVNVIFTKRGPLFLENCFRFGYAAYPSMFHVLARHSLEETLRQWITGKEQMDSWFRNGFAGSLTLTNDCPKDGQPLLIPEAIENQVDVYRAYKQDGHLRLTEGWPEICAVTAKGETIVEAGDRCLKLAEQVSFPGKGYRLDLAKSDLPTLPLSRFRALQFGGYLG